jgi:O-antigen/teichoic acid export membrane protein
MQTHTSTAFEPSKAIDRFGRGAAALSLNQVVFLASRLVVVPVAMFVWGKTLYGEWILLAGLVSFLSLADLGVQTFVVNRLTTSFACNDRETFNRDLLGALRVQTTLGFTLLVIVGALVEWLPLRSVLGLVELNHLQFSITFLLLAFELLLSVPTGVVAGVYRATGHLARGAIVGAGKETAIIFATIVAMFCSKDLAYVAAARVAVGLGISSFIIVDVRHLHSWLRLWPRTGSYRIGLAMVVPGLFFLLIPMANYIESQSTLVFVQRFLNSGEVSRLATHRTAVNLGRMISGLLTISIWPEITALYALRDLQRLRACRRMLVRFHFWLIGGCAFIVFFLVPAVYPLWTARQLAIDMPTLAILTIRLALWAFWYPSAIVLMAVNKHRLIACSALASALIAGTVAFSLVPMMGISGAALATLLGDLSTSAWIAPWLASRELGESVTASLFQTLIAPLWAFVPAFGIATLGWMMSTSPVLRFGLFFPLAIGTGVWLVRKQLTTEERALILRGASHFPVPWARLRAIMG